MIEYHGGVYIVSSGVNSGERTGGNRLVVSRQWLVVSSGGAASAFFLCVAHLGIVVVGYDE